MVTLAQATAWIGRHEAFRALAYYDTQGHLTIGWGTNLDAPMAEWHCKAVGLDYQALRNGAPIGRAQADELLDTAAQHAIDFICARIKGVTEMAQAVQLAMVDMAYNMGAGKFCTFMKMLLAIEAHDWKTAAAEMKDSLWFHQVKTRADDDIALVLSALGAAA